MGEQTPMTLAELGEQKATLDKTHDNKIKALYKLFAMSNNTVKVGDIVEDHYQRVKVEKIGWYINTPGAGCTYTGPLYSKKMVPFKSGARDTMYQENLKVNHGQ